MTKYDAGECTSVELTTQWNIVIASIFSFFSPVTLSWFYRANAFAIICLRVAWATASTGTSILFFFSSSFFFFFVVFIFLFGCLKVFNKWCAHGPKHSFMFANQAAVSDRTNERTKCGCEYERGTRCIKGDRYIFLLNFNRFFCCPFHFSSIAFSEL